jgi:predicted HAD superfamily Cof-like phosphohydrolase
VNLFESIKEFHGKFDLWGPDRPAELSEELHIFRTKFMMEELEEYIDAYEDGNLEKQLDALVDLAYVVLGTAYLHGFDFNEAFRRVHEANLKKIRAVKDTDSLRGSTYDVVKPEGWSPPDLSDLVG